MNIQITCRGLENSAPLEAQIRKQLEKVVTFLGHDREPSSIQLTIDVHPSHAHNEVHLHITAPRYRVVAHREGYEVQALIDQVIDIAYEDLHKQKAKHIHDRNDRDGHRGV